MTYSCSDFLDSIMTALGVTGDDDGPDDQVAEIADKCLAEIARLQAIAGPVGASRRQKAQAGDMKSYRVTWEIDVEADSPEEAAVQAREHQTRPGTTATIFSVFQEGGGGFEKIGPNLDVRRGIARTVEDWDNNPA